MKIVPFRRYNNILPIMVLWLAFGLRLYRIDYQSIWWDEGHSIFVASTAISDIPTLPAMDVHPPAYFILLHLWMKVAGQSEFALRYLSVMASLLTVALIWCFAASLLHQKRASLLLTIKPEAISSFPWLAGLLAALSPMYVAYGQEVRSYALVTFLALASTFALWKLLLTRAGRDRVERRGLLVLYVVMTAACLYTHYFTIFLLFFQNLIWLIWLLIGTRREVTSPAKASPPGSAATRLRRRIEGVRLWLGSQAGILLLFSPQLILAWRQITGYTNPNLVPPSPATFISRSWQAYTVGLTIDPTPAQWGMAAIGGVLILGWLFQFSFRSRFFSVFSLLFSFFFLVLWFTIPLAAYFIVLQVQPSFEPRYMILVTPALFLLFGLGLSEPPAGSDNFLLRPAFYILRLVLIAAFLTGLYSYYTNEAYFKDDSAGVAAWLAAETRSDDVVYVDVPHPFHYYAEQRHIPAPIRYLFVDIHTAAERLTQEASGRDRLFWVTWRGSDTDPRQVIPFLAEKTGDQVGQREFRGYQVTWFDLPDKDQLKFSLPKILTPTNVIFGDVLQLDGMAFGGQQGQMTTAGEPIWATLHFNLLRETDIDYKVSLRLRAEDGQLVAQTDGDLLNDRHFRTSAWPIDDLALNQAINVYLLSAPADTPPGRYRLEAVVYRAEPPYPSEGVTGHENTDGVAATLGEITVIP